MKQDKFPFNGHVQRMILKLMLTSAPFLNGCRQNLKSKYFEDQYHQWMFDCIVNYYQKYNVVITVEILKNEILKFDPLERPMYERAVDMVLHEDANRSDSYIRDNLTYFAKHQCLIESLEIVQQRYNNNPAGFNFNYMGELSQSLNKIKFDDDGIFDLDKIAAILEEAKNSSLHRLPLGIPHIDEALLGGIEKSGYLSFLGPMNAGKSMILVNITRNFIESGKKVLFVNLEESIDRMVKRFIASISRIEYGKFHRAMASWSQEELDRVSHAKALMKENLFIKNWYAYGVSVEDLYHYCLDKRSVLNFDAIVIDYAGILRLKNHGGYNKTDYLEPVSNVLKSLANEIQLPVITAVQGNRDAQKKSLKFKGGDELVRASDIGDCFAFTRPLDTCITITRSDMDEQNNRVRFLLDKTREDRKGTAVLCETNFACCRVLAPELNAYEIFNDASDDSLIQNHQSNIMQLV